MMPPVKVVIITRRIRGLSGSKSARNDVRIWQYGDG